MFYDVLLSFILRNVNKYCLWSLILLKMCTPKYSLLKNVHASLSPLNKGSTFLSKETYNYYHYCCDESKDSGYGCGYRTIQSICSMLKNRLGKGEVPSIKNIQEILVKIGDKPQTIIGSRDWIGSVEASYIFDELFGIPSYLIHIPSGENIASKTKEMVDYFTTQGGLIFMGGDCDAAAKMIAGIHVAEDDKISLLIVDPHFQGTPKSANELIHEGYVKWFAEDDFLEASFYNLCLPKIQ